MPGQDYPRCRRDLLRISGWRSLWRFACRALFALAGFGTLLLSVGIYPSESKVSLPWFDLFEGSGDGARAPSDQQSPCLSPLAPSSQDPQSSLLPFPPQQQQLRHHSSPPVPWHTISMMPVVELPVCSRAGIVIWLEELEAQTVCWSSGLGFGGGVFFESLRGL